MNSRFTLTTLLGGALVAAALSGCSAADSQNDPDEGCTSGADCEAGLSCIDGVCIDESAGECTTSTDCPEGEACVNGSCQEGRDAGGFDAEDAADVTRDVPSSDTIVEDSTLTDTDDTDAGPGPDAAQDVEEDIDYGPLSFEVTPGEGATDVPLDTVFTVSFNQPMSALTLAPRNIDIIPLGGAGDPPYPYIDYDPETFVMTVTPCAEEDAIDGTCDDPLQLVASTPYEFRMSNSVRSASGLNPDSETRIQISTTGFPGTEFHQELAEAYAPVIYQEVEIAQVDTFTSVFFDGDEDPSDNFDSSRGANPGHVYYSLVETPSHYFLSYWIYYPQAQTNPTANAEHDTLGVQVVVAKSDDDPLGTLRAFTTFEHGTYSRWAIDSSFYADGQDVSADLAGRLPLSYLENERNVSVFVESLDHALCTPTQDVGRCSPSSGENAPFGDDLVGLVYRRGPIAQRAGDADDEALSYLLESFDTNFWVRRASTSGDGSFYAGTSTYRPAQLGEEEFRPGSGNSYPSSLEFDHDGDSFGDMPFSYARLTAFPSDPGWWFVDPAYLFNEQFTTPEDVSLEYCFNPYLTVDVRDTLEGCTPSDFSLPE